MTLSKLIPLLAASGTLLLAAGCATGPEAVENDFGNSVRQMQQAQAANPMAPADSNPLDHGDGERINGAIDAYRKGASDPKGLKDAMMSTDSSR
jgi:type IV pilus biogenesis protein CpaD/CtpE